MTKIKRPQKVLAIDDRDTVRLSPLINTPYNYITQELEYRYVSLDWQGLIIKEKDLNDNYEMIKEFSYIDYNKDSLSFFHHPLMYKSKKLDYYIIIDPQLNNEDDDYIMKKGFVRVTALGFDSSNFELSEIIPNELNKYIYFNDDNTSSVALVFKTMQGFTFKNHDITPLPVDVDLMYNDDFKEVHEHIISSLKDSKKGIILLHGGAGTGKTNYIKHLTTLVPKKKFVFIPVSMIPYLTDPNFITTLIDNKGSVLVLEDSETYLKDRGDSENTVVSALLNLSDGMLSDVLGIQIICTFNAGIENVDKALLRKGRLIDEYEFKELSLDKSKRLAYSLGIKAEINNPMTLAELTNFNDKSHRNEKGTTKIGFK